MTAEGLDPRHASRYAPVAAAVILTIGLYLRLTGIAEYWVNPDEGIYYSTLTQPSFSDFWAEVQANAHPPGYYLLLRGLSLFTWDFVWLRGVSVIFGGAAIWLAWLVGNEMGGRGRSGAVAGLAGAALLAFNEQAIALSQVMRPYALLTALLLGALLAQLRYRRSPTKTWAAAYTMLLVAGVLTHYSAALAVGVFVALALHDRITDRVAPEAWRRLVLAHLTVGAVLFLTYIVHLRDLTSSAMAGAALDADGWLSGWMVSSPRAWWSSFLDVQTLHGPGELRTRFALLLLAAIGLSATRHDRTAAVLAVSALTIAAAVSVLGLYPFGPSRHNAWLVAFTVPTLAYLPGEIVRMGRRPAVIAAAVAALIVAAGPLELALAPGTAADRDHRTIATEERTLRWHEIAPLIVERLDPSGAPRIVLMTEQTYDLLMPLYPTERYDARPLADSMFHFSYGSREIVVVRTWDWGPPFDLTSVVRTVTDALASRPGTFDDEMLLLAGGWGSALFLDVPGLRERGIISDESVAVGRDAVGEPLIRLLACTLSWRTLIG